MADYLNIEYDAQSHPKNEYPDRLACHLFERFGMRSGQKILEPGCGRGEFLNGFRKLGMSCFGADLSPEAGTMLEGVKVIQTDIERDPLPFEDETFDYIYHKSLLEHLWHPDRFMNEAFRVLKPRGALLSLVPDWESNYKTYFDDYTHRTPFTMVSLENIYRMCDFTQVKIVKLRQLPIVWKYPALNLICAAISPFIPVRTKSKFFRWSRELMLVGSGIKPNESRA
jgi:SAM-dependent methyltransferase